jgi:hypothetical protein
MPACAEADKLVGVGGIEGIRQNKGLCYVLRTV